MSKIEAKSRTFSHPSATEN